MNRVLPTVIGLTVAAAGIWWFATYWPVAAGSDYLIQNASPDWQAGLLWGSVFGALAWTLAAAVIRLLAVSRGLAMVFAIIGSLELVLAALLLRALLTDWQVESPEWAVQRLIWFLIGVYVATLLACLAIARQRRPIIRTDASRA